MEQLQILKEKVYYGAISFYQSTVEKVDIYVGADKEVKVGGEGEQLNVYLRERGEKKLNRMVVEVGSWGVKGWLVGHVLGCLVKRQAAVGLCTGLFMGISIEQHMNGSNQYSLEIPQQIRVYQQVKVSMEDIQKGDFSNIYQLDDNSHTTQPLKELSRVAQERQPLGAFHYLIPKWM